MFVFLFRTLFLLRAVTSHGPAFPILLFLAAHHDLQRIVGQWRCSALASSHGARIQTSRSSSVVNITGMALGWIGSTTAVGAVVRKP
jgi:hypothetical protein